MVAGATSIVSALWEVDDTMTAALMRQFYSHLARGLEPAEALRSAKTDLQRRYGRATTHGFTSAFVVTGE
jgi:CHAT domain-containing protein